MHQSATYSTSSTSITLPESNTETQKQRSLLGRIFTQFWKYSKCYSIEYQTKNQHQNFIDANLLDQNIGHEISRTLRR